MGNRICRSGRGAVVEERLTRPQRLVRQPSNVDYRKLRRLILSEKLAPCFDALEDPGVDLEECPICFFYYPSLNRSRCCAKGICTECFLQMKPSNATGPAECPFCKTSCYAVEFCGARTEEEKGLELAEEQKVIEAKIRMQCQESQNVEKLMPTNETCSLLDVQSPTSCLGGLPSGDIQGVRSGVSLTRDGTDVDDSPVPDACSPRHEEFDVGLEEIMLMEAIWQSLKDTQLERRESTQTSSPGNKTPERGAQGSNKNVPFLSFIGQHEASSSESSTARVECIIARLEEHNSLQSEAVERICSSSEANFNPCEESAEGSDETGTDIECLEHRSSSTEDDSWGSISARYLEGNHGLEYASASDEGTTAEADSGSDCSGSTPSVSSTPSESPPPSGDGVAGRFYSKLSDLMDAERSVMIVKEFNAES